VKSLTFLETTNNGKSPAIQVRAKSESSEDSESFDIVISTIPIPQLLQLENFKELFSIADAGGGKSINVFICHQ